MGAILRLHSSVLRIASVIRMRQRHESDSAKTMLPSAPQTALLPDAQSIAQHATCQQQLMSNSLDPGSAGFFDRTDAANMTISPQLESEAAAPSPADGHLQLDEMEATQSVLPPLSTVPASSSASKASLACTAYSDLGILIRSVTFTSTILATQTGILSTLPSRPSLSLPALDPAQLHGSRSMDLDGDGLVYAGTEQGDIAQGLGGKSSIEFLQDLCGRSSIEFLGGSSPDDLPAALQNQSSSAWAKDQPGLPPAELLDGAAGLESESHIAPETMAQLSEGHAAPQQALDVKLQQVSMVSYVRMLSTPSLSGLIVACSRAVRHKLFSS